MTTEQSLTSEREAQEFLDRKGTVYAPCEPTMAKLLAVLHEGRRAIGDHCAPNDCYATGPVTGDAYRDLVECPACSFIAMYDELLSAAKSGSER